MRLVKQPCPLLPSATTVARGDDEYDVRFRWVGRYWPATRLDPEEFPEPEVESVTLNGVPIAVDLVPEDVLDEAFAADHDPGEEPEPDEDDSDRGG